MRMLLIALALWFELDAAHAADVSNPCTQLALTSAECDPVNSTNPLPIAPNTYPAASTPITASATGTTGATTATLAAAANKMTYLCGFSIRANATAAATGNATVTGTVNGTLNFTQWTAPLASGIGIVEPPIVTCIPASAVNTGISVVSAAPGSGGTVSVSAWGYQQ
jgi:hypothetical protein